MFEAPSAQPGDSPPRPHGLQQTLSLSLSWFMDRHHHTKSIKYTVKKCINIYIHSIHTDIDIRYMSIYKIYTNLQEPAIFMSNNANTLLKTISPRFVDQVYIGETVNKAISMFVYVMDVLTKRQSLTRSHFVPNTKHWVAHGLLCRIYWRTIIPNCESAIIR